MEERTGLLRVVLILFVILVVGTVGYVIIERWSVLDALYMTIITISTVGYSEVHTLSVAGKAFSSVLIVCGVGAAFYALTTLMQHLIRGNLRNLFGGGQSMEDTISRLVNHCIVCDYGRVGRVIARRFRAEGVDFVVVDPDPDAIAQAKADGCLYVQADPSVEENLVKAGIQKARGVLVVRDNDATNTFIIVTARHVRPDVRIVARAGSEESEAKLEMVGADKAMNPYSSVGERMARSALHPVVSDFLERVLPGPGKEQFLESVEIAEKSVISGKTIGEAQEYSGGAVILAVRKRGDPILPKPSEDTVIVQGDRLVILGSEEQVSRMEHLIDSG